MRKSISVLFLALIAFTAQSFAAQVPAQPAASPVIDAVHQPKPVKRKAEASLTQAAFKPLQSATVLKAYNEARVMVKQQQAMSVPPSKAVLTTQAPVSGKSMIFIEAVEGGQFDPTRNVSSIRKGWFSFLLETIPGKTYLVDIQLAVQGSININLGGAINGIFQLQDVQKVNSYEKSGHLLGAFTAKESITELDVYAPDSVKLYFYRFEMKLVN